MTAIQFNLIFDSKDRNGVGECTTAPIPVKRNCYGRYCSFGTLLQMHQRQNPTLPYLIARVKGATGNVDFYDGAKAVKQLSSRFCDLFNKDPVKSVVFFEHVTTTDSEHQFRQVARCMSSVAINKNDLLQKYAKCHGNEPVRAIFEKACLLLNSDDQKVQEEGYFLLGKACIACFEQSPDTATAEGVEVLNLLLDFYYRGRKGLERDYKIALQLAEKLCELDPNNACAFSISGVIYYDGGNGIPEDHHLAKVFLEKAANIDPDLYVVQYYLGKIALEEGNAEEAKVCLEKAYRNQSGDVEVALLLAELLGSDKYSGVVQQNLERANSLVRSVLKRAPENAEAVTLQLSFQRLQDVAPVEAE